MAKKNYIDFAKSFPHHGEESDYCFTEIASRMQKHGVVMDNILGYYLQAPMKIRRGLKIETPKGLVKMTFEKIPKGDGYHVDFKKI